MQILYCRIGWMNSYHGSLIEKPLNGGKYNIDNIGHEVHNYMGFNGEYYGFVEAGVNNSIHVEKLGGTKGGYAEDVLVVWVSTKPTGGQYIIRWYKDATVYSKLQVVPSDVMEGRELKDHNFYNIYSRNVFLIEPYNRNYKLEGMGHINIWYGKDETDKKVIEYINNYDKQHLDRIDSIETDFSNISGGEKEAIVKIRINQDKFRDMLIKKYGKCCLCGVNDKNLLIASHIKPWAKSDDYEKLDVENGLLLCPNHDKLFDSGFISFNDSGEIIISEQLDDINQMFMNVNSKMRISITPGNEKYIEFHRSNIFI